MYMMCMYVYDVYVGVCVYMMCMYVYDVYV